MPVNTFKGIRRMETSETAACAVFVPALSLALTTRRPLLSKQALSERGIDIQNVQSNDVTALRLVEAAGLRDACDLDLLLFFSRHPRVVLSSEHLASYVGYELNRVSRALDLLLGAGLLKRTHNQGTPGRMYVLEVDRAEEWLEPLRRLCATPDGRHALKALLKQRRAKNGDARPRPLPAQGRRDDA